MGDGTPLSSVTSLTTSASSISRLARKTVGLGTVLPMLSSNAKISEASLLVGTHIVVRCAALKESYLVRKSANHLVVFIWSIERAIPSPPVRKSYCCVHIVV